MCGQYEYNPTTDKMVRVSNSSKVDRKAVVAKTAERLSRDIQQKYEKEIKDAERNHREARSRFERQKEDPMGTTKGDQFSALDKKLKYIGDMARAISKMEKAGQTAEEERKKLKEELRRIARDENIIIQIDDNGNVISENDWQLNFLPFYLRLGGLIDDLPFSRNISGKLQRVGELFGAVLLGSTSKLGKVQNLPSLGIQGDALEKIGERFHFFREYAYCLRAGHIHGMARTIREIGITPIYWLETRIDRVNPSYRDYLKMHAWREAVLYAFAYGMIPQEELTHIEEEINTCLQKIEGQLGLSKEGMKDLYTMDEQLLDVTREETESTAPIRSDLTMHVSNTTRERLLLAITEGVEDKEGIDLISIL